MAGSGCDSPSRRSPCPVPRHAARRARRSSRSRHIREAARGDMVLRRGDHAAGLLVLLRGWPRVCVLSTRSGEVTLTLLGPGEVLGEMASGLGTDDRGLRARRSTGSSGRSRRWAGARSTAAGAWWSRPGWQPGHAYLVHHFARAGWLAGRHVAGIELLGPGCGGVLDPARRCESAALSGCRQVLHEPSARRPWPGIHTGGALADALRILTDPIDGGRSRQCRDHVFHAMSMAPEINVDAFRQQRHGNRSLVWVGRETAEHSHAGCAIRCIKTRMVKKHLTKTAPDNTRRIKYPSTTGHVCIIVDVSDNVHQSIDCLDCLAGRCPAPL